MHHEFPVFMLVGFRQILVTSKTVVLSQGFNEASVARTPCTDVLCLWHTYQMRDTWV